MGLVKSNGKTAKISTGTWMINTAAVQVQGVAILLDRKKTTSQRVTKIEDTEVEDIQE